MTLVMMVARLAHEKLPQLTVAAINCPSHESACSQHGVHEFPTLIIFPGTGPSLKITQRDRSAAAVVAWAAHHAPNASNLSQAPSDWARDAPERVGGVGGHQQAIQVHGCLVVGVRDLHPLGVVRGRRPPELHCRAYH